jgi:hypothetical protein
MARDLISKKTRYEFREYFVGVVLREIEMEFDAADVPCDKDYNPPMSGARRSLVEQYYHAVDWTKWRDVRKVLTVYENILARLEDAAKETYFGNPEWASRTFHSLQKWLERDGYKYQDGKLVPVGKDHVLTDISDTASRFDMPELDRQIERMKSAIDDDPSLAIGTAKELIETPVKRS